MFVDDEMVKETLEQLKNGEISFAEAREIIEWFDGDLIDFL